MHTTLFEILTRHRERQQHKHGLPDTHVKDEINSLTNYEFLEEISEALQIILANRIE